MPACLHVHNMSAMEAQQHFVRWSILVTHYHREVIIILLQKSITDKAFACLCTYVLIILCTYMPCLMLKPRPGNLVSYSIQVAIHNKLFGFCIFSITSSVVLNRERILTQLGIRTYTYLCDGGLAASV